MADSEIQILIKAVDEVTSTMKKIETQLDTSNKNMQKQAKATSMSFEEQIGVLVSVGNAAASVDRIFDSYENLQLRLENATERVNGAQDRLRDAQYKLNKVMKDGTSTAEDIANAEQNVESATRSLTISQNNLQRAQNQVIGTYINIGLQLANLAVTVPRIISAINLWRQSEQALNLVRTIGLALTNPVILATGLAAATIGTMAIAQMQATDNTNSFNSSQSNLITTTSSGTLAIQDQITALSDLSQKMQDTVSENTIWFQAVQTVKAKEKQINDEMLKSYEREKALRSAGRIEEANQEVIVRQALLAQLVDIQKNFNDEVEKVAQAAMDAENKRKEAAFQEEMRRLIALEAEYKRVADLQDKIWGSAGAGATGGKGTRIDLAPKVNAPAFHDFISRPGQEPTNFSSSDTIIGMKDIGDLRGGISITITGNIYGTDPDEIAEALVDKLRRKITI